MRAILIVEVLKRSMAIMIPRSKESMRYGKKSSFHRRCATLRIIDLYQSFDCFIDWFIIDWMSSSNCNCNWVTCIAPFTRRPRAHHRVNPYPGARRQNGTKMFSYHDETSPLITAVSAPSVACSILVVQQQKRLCSSRPSSSNSSSSSSSSVAKRSRTNTPLMRNEEIPNSQSQTTYFDLLKLELTLTSPNQRRVLFLVWSNDQSTSTRPRRTGDLKTTSSDGVGGPRGRTYRRGSRTDRSECLIRPPNT